MALRQTLPRAQWKPAHFWLLNKQNKEKRMKKEEEVSPPEVTFGGESVTFGGEEVVWNS